MIPKKKQPKEGKSLADRGIFVRTREEKDHGKAVDRYYDDEFYQEIWDERPHMCFETYQDLPSEPLTLYFHHILPKAKYPQYRHSKWNIVILHPNAHSQVEFNIHKCPRVKALTEHLKLVYG